MFGVKLIKPQWDTLSDIFANLGYIAIASVALPYILDKFDFFTFLTGIILAFLFWFISVIISKKA